MDAPVDLDAPPLDADSLNPYTGERTYAVMTASGKIAADEGQHAVGGEVWLQTEQEAEYYASQRDKYLEQYKYSNVSDLSELDRVLLFETVIFRWSIWLSRGWDYQEARAEEHVLKQNIADYSKEVRSTKAALGMDKATREKDKGESVSEYLANLRRRAMEFGIKRNAEYEMAVNLLMTIKSMVGTYLRADEEERRILDISPEQIVQWIDENLIPQFDAIDESFRKEQKIWIRSV